MEGSRLTVRRDGVDLSVIDRGGEGPPLILLHGLAGSARELLPTADRLTDSYRVLLMDQRGHGCSTRRPADLSRAAFVEDVRAVMAELAPGRTVTLVGQSMGAHTAFLVAATYPDLVERLVLLEGHVAGAGPEEAAVLGRYFASWPVPFATESEARAFLGSDPIVDAWVADFDVTDEGLRPRFDADVMQHIIEAVHEPRWTEWESLRIPTLAVFARGGMFDDSARDELIRRRPETDRIDLPTGSHDAHLDAFEEWIGALRGWLLPSADAGAR